MEKGFLIQITNELYRITRLFPKKEPLRYKMREMANEILLKCLRNPTPNPILKDLEVLNSFLEVAKNQNWVSPKELLNLQKEYSKLGEEILKSEIEKKSTFPKPSLPETPQNKDSEPLLTEREKKILEMLKEKRKLQVWQVKQIFPQVSKRTLRRDFTRLLKKGLIERLGEKNQVFYQLKE